MDTVSFYDALDRRIGRKEGATTTWTLYDGQGTDPLLDFVNGATTPTTRYLNGPQGAIIDMVLARQSSSGVAWYLPDRLGTIRDLVDNTGALIDHVDYGAFGNVLSESNPSNGDRLMGFAQLERDTATGLNLAVHRVEDPGTGRWDSQDPSAFAAGDANLYRYVGNSPSNSSDLYGLGPGDQPMGGGQKKREPNRWKFGKDLNDQYKGLLKNRGRQVKGRPSPMGPTENDPEGDWEGVKKPPKQCDIASDDKSRRRPPIPPDMDPSVGTDPGLLGGILQSLFPGIGEPPVWRNHDGVWRDQFGHTDFGPYPPGLSPSPGPGGSTYVCPTPSPVRLPPIPSPRPIFVSPGPVLAPG